MEKTKCDKCGENTLGKIVAIYGKTSVCLPCWWQNDRS